MSLSFLHLFYIYIYIYTRIIKTSQNNNLKATPVTFGTASKSDCSCQGPLNSLPFQDVAILSRGKKTHFSYSFIRKSVPNDISSSFKGRNDALSSKQGHHVCIQNNTLIKSARKYFRVYIYIHIFIFKHNMNFLVCGIRQIDGQMRPLLRQLLDRQILHNIMRLPNLRASVYFSEIPCITDLC